MTTCRACGRPLDNRIGRRGNYCRRKACIAARRREWRDRAAQQQTGPKDENLTLLHDPTGDFRPGAQFPRYHVALMLKADGQRPPETPPTLADGTLFRGPGGKVLTVRGGRVVNDGGGLVTLVKAVRR